jgi:hypothetical protein
VFSWARYSENAGGALDEKCGAKFEYATIESIIGVMKRRLSVFFFVALLWFIADSAAIAGSVSHSCGAESTSSLPSVTAAGDDVSTVACNEKPSSAPAVKQEAGKTLPKATAAGPRPVRLSRIRAMAATSCCGAFLPPDTLQMRDVRLQV